MVVVKLDTFSTELRGNYSGSEVVYFDRVSFVVGKTREEIVSAINKTFFEE